MNTKTPQPKNKLESILFPEEYLVTDVKDKRGIELCITKSSGLKDIPKELIDYEMELLDMYIPHRRNMRTGNIDLGTCDALVVRVWGKKQCFTRFCAILVRPFDEADRAIYENMASLTMNKPNERLKLNFDNR